MKARQKRHKCPKCGKYYVDYPALSRVDNKTEICPDCGVVEVIDSYRFFHRSKDELMRFKTFQKLCFASILSVSSSEKSLL